MRVPPNHTSHHPYTYVDLSAIDDEMICPICQFPFIDPTVHRSCGNTFCAKCISDLSSCPLCHKEEEGFLSECNAAPRVFKNQLDKLKVVCSMCKNAVPRAELEQHQQTTCSLRLAHDEIEEKKKRLEMEFEERVKKLEERQEQVLLESFRCLSASSDVSKSCFIFFRADASCTSACSFSWKS